MQPEIQQKISEVFKAQKDLLEKNWDLENDTDTKDQQLKKILIQKTNDLNIDLKNRIFDEIEKLGPLEKLISDEDITEILVNSANTVLYEKNGCLVKSEDHFFDSSTYNQCIERISQMCHSYMNKEKPFIETQIGTLRFTLIYSDLARGEHLLSIRKQPKDIWTLEKLKSKNWCKQQQLELIQKILIEHKNFLFVGGTSSGKTSALQALMNDISSDERLVIIEDTQELRLCNPLSVSLLTRTDILNKNNDVTMTDLLKRALRLRPDRLVVGEIRGAEATNLLMALATGHDGSFGSMHAKSASEALLRLEMLIQMGAPQWSLQSIRRLIGLTVEYIFVVEKKNGHRKLEGIYKITSVEENGITLMKLDDDLQGI
jgi:pilus assembly protein CpaF